MQCAAAGAALLALAGFAGANPTAPTVVSGTATFATSGNILNITNSPSAIINWGSFSIGVNELTRFIQQSASSAVLNRVIGQDPSAILGTLQSNGRVFLVNPNGIVFGAGSQINVAGLVASTLNLSNEDFLANRMRFTDGAGAGSVVNQGNLTGGSVYLIGKSVTNDGIITNPQGEVILAAGNSVELVNPGTPNLRVEIVAPDNEARNLGQIVAASGRIGIYAGLIRSSGIINADRAVSGPGGSIMLKSGGDLVVSGLITALDGNITLEAVAIITDNEVTINGGSIIINTPFDGSGQFVGDGTICATTAGIGGNGCGGGFISNGVVVTVTGGTIPTLGDGILGGLITASPIPQSLTAGAQALLGNIRTNEIIQRASAGILSLQGMVLPTISQSGVLHAPVTTPSLQFDIKRNQGVTR